MQSANKLTYGQRLLTIAAKKARQAYPNGTKDEQLVYQLGYITGMLSKYAVNDIAIKQDIQALEDQLGIVYKK